MKKFFTAISPATTHFYAYNYTAHGNAKLQMPEDTKVHFPILTAINGYVNSGESFEIVAVISDLPATWNNYQVFKDELKELCTKRGFLCQTIHEIVVPNDENVATHISTFETLIRYVSDGDDLYSDLTFGTKPLSTVIQMAIQYAYRVKDTTIGCIVYGLITRINENSDIWKADVYDQSALIQLDEIVRLLADRNVQDPAGAIHAILSL